jgi:hypothetical protein
MNGIIGANFFLKILLFLSLSQQMRIYSHVITPNLRTAPLGLIFLHEWAFIKYEERNPLLRGLASVIGEYDAEE